MEGVEVREGPKEVLFPFSTPPPLPPTSSAFSSISFQQLHCSFSVVSRENSERENGVLSVGAPIPTLPIYLAKAVSKNQECDLHSPRFFIPSCFSSILFSRRYLFFTCRENLNVLLEFVCRILTCSELSRWSISLKKSKGLQCQ